MNTWNDIFFYLFHTSLLPFAFLYNALLFLSRPRHIVLRRIFSMGRFSVFHTLLTFRSIAILNSVYVTPKDAYCRYPVFLVILLSRIPPLVSSINKFGRDGGQRSRTMCDNVSLLFLYLRQRSCIFAARRYSFRFIELHAGITHIACPHCALYTIV